MTQKINITGHIGTKSIQILAYAANVATPKTSVALVRERTIPTERPPPVGEVSANFCG